MKEDEMRLIAGWIARVLRDPGNEALVAEVRARSRPSASGFSLYAERIRAGS
jgi:glycine/serine hydroxymethyltransferase